METIIVKLDAGKVENADIDIVHLLPAGLEKYTDNKIMDNGYDYLSHTQIAVWLKTEDAEKYYPLVVEYIKNNIICNNNLSKTVEIYISDNDSAELEDCKKVYPTV